MSTPDGGQFAEHMLDYLQIVAGQTADLRFTDHLALYLLTLILIPFLFVISVRA